MVGLEDVMDRGLTFGGSGKEWEVVVVGWGRSSWDWGGRRGGIVVGFGGMFEQILLEDVEVSFGGRISGVDYMAGRRITWMEVRKCLGDIE